MKIENSKSIGIFSNTFWSIYNFRRALIKRLLLEGYHVIAVSADDRHRKLVEELGCETVVIKNFDAQSTAILKEAAIIREIVQTLRNLPFQYIYTFTIKPNLYTALTSSLTGKKIILTVNGLGNVFSEGNLINKVALQLFKNAFRKAYQIVFQNEDDYNFFKERIGLGMTKVKFVKGSGVNTDEFTFSHKLPTQGNQLTFLLACRLLKEKGVLHYIESARIIKATYPHVKFWLLGMEAKNPSAISLKDIQQFSDEGIIQLIPQTDDVNSLLDKADVLVLPSFYNEGIPRILLEGLSKGMPIITTNSVGCKETITDELNGFMIEPRSSKNLEEAITKMINLSVEEREKMRSESRKRAEKDFNEKKVIDTYLHIIQQPFDMLQNFAVNPLSL